MDAMAAIYQGRRRDKGEEEREELGKRSVIMPEATKINPNAPLQIELRVLNVGI